MSDLIDFLIGFDFTVTELQRRFENSQRPGVVHEVDPAKQRVRLLLGGTEASPFLSPWVPYSQVAGELKVHSPPSKGQQMIFVCPDGDFRRGYAVPFTWSNQNPSPSSRGDEHVTTYGKSKQTVRKGQIRQEVGPQAAHEVLEKAVSSKVGGSLVRLLRNQVRAAASRIDLN